MNTKKDMIRASKIVQDLYLTAYQPRNQVSADSDGEAVYDCSKPIAVENAFVQFFQTDNPAFDEKRFRLACMPEGK
jgi:hypothetical protein